MSTAVEQPILTAEEQFQAERMQGIGGSDVGDIFNVGYGCARKCAYEKIGVPRDFSHTPEQERLFKRGKRLEEVVADEYAEINERKIRRVGGAVSREYPWMLVHMDRIILNDRRGPGYLEAKTASPWTFSEMQETGLPDGYSLQLQHGLIVKRYQWGAFGVMDMASWRMLAFERELNKELATVIIAKESEFWHGYVLPSRQILADNNDAKIQSLLPILQLPPQLDNPRDRRCASCLWRKTCRGTADIVPDPKQTGYVVDDNLAELAGDYIDALNIAAARNSLVEQIKEQLKQACGDRTGVVIPSVSKRIRWKEQQGRLGWDTKALEGAIGSFRSLEKLLKQHGGPISEETAAQLATTVEVISNQLVNARKRGEPTRPWYFEEWDGKF